MPETSTIRIHLQGGPSAGPNVTHRPASSVVYPSNGGEYHYVGAVHISARTGNPMPTYRHSDLFTGDDRRGSWWDA